MMRFPRGTSLVVFRGSPGPGITSKLLPVPFGAPSQTSVYRAYLSSGGHRAGRQSLGSGSKSLGAEPGQVTSRVCLLPHWGRGINPCSAAGLNTLCEAEVGDCERSWKPW